MVKRISTISFVILILVMLNLPCFAASPQYFVATDKALPIGDILNTPLNMNHTTTQVSHYVYPSYPSTYYHDSDNWITYPSWSEVFTPQTYIINQNAPTVNQFGEITAGISNIEGYGYSTYYTDTGIDGNTSITNSYNGIRVVSSGVSQDSLYLSNLSNYYDVYYIDYQYMPNSQARYATTNYKYMGVGQYYLYYDHNGVSGDTYRGLEINFDSRDSGVAKNYYLSISGVLYGRNSMGEIYDPVNLDLLTSINGYFNIAHALGMEYDFYEAVFEGTIVLAMSGDIGAFPVIRTFIPEPFMNSVTQTNSLQYIATKGMSTDIISYFWRNYDTSPVIGDTIYITTNGTHNVEGYKWANVYVTDVDDSFWSVIMNGVKAFFDFPIGGSEFTIGGVFVIILAVSVVIIFLKIFAGG